MLKCLVVVVMVVTLGEGQESQEEEQSLLGGVVSGLRQLPILGNVLKATLHPIYRPLVSQFQPRINSRDGEEDDLSDICFGELGCITIDDDFFHPINRPLNLPPNRREEINVTFTVHSREDSLGTVVEALNLPRVLNTTFDTGRNTKILVHGFMDHNGITWMWDMVRAFLVYDDLNVVTVDWSGGSHALYSQATANTRVVGLEIAFFINWLKDKADLNPKDVHIVGHSLGSHIAGYAGERVPGLGRITGLDPAEPYFQYMPTSVRLDPSDALFVDVIHTDADSIFNIGTGFGLQQAIGHLDFYPNDGRSQPGCDSLIRVPMTALTDGASIYEGMDAAQKELVACSHNRAPKLFTDSLLSHCPYMAFQCDSYKSYMDGECGSCGEDWKLCARMGIHANTWPVTNQSQGRFYLSTGQGPHFCLYHYRLMMELADPNKLKGSLHGKLTVSFILDDGSIKDFNLTPENPESFARGKTYSFFIYHHEDLSSASEALVRWTYETNMFNPLSYCVPLFCDTSLPLARLVFISVDNIAFRRLRSRERNVVMCHKQGLDVVKVESETSVKVVSSPACLTITRGNNTNHLQKKDNLTGDSLNDDLTSTTQDLLNASFASLSSMFPFS